MNTDESQMSTARYTKHTRVKVEYTQKAKMNFFAKTVDGLKAVKTIFENSSILVLNTAQMRL